jgi:hypothetical protein
MSLHFKPQRPGGANGFTSGISIAQITFDGFATVAVSGDGCKRAYQ